MKRGSSDDVGIDVGSLFMEGHAMVGADALRQVAAIFAQVPDPRKRRGVRHPFGAILSLVFLGLLGRITEMATLARWAAEHWQELKEPLGFTRDKPPCDTTISRALAGLRVETFQRYFQEFLRAILAGCEEVCVGAVDGKACRQGKDKDGSPVMVLHVFIQKVKLTVGQWVVGRKENEVSCLRKHLGELLEAYPCLRLLTGDALYAQRPLLEALQELGCDYLFQVKENQPELLEALLTCFAQAERRVPDAQEVRKRGAQSR